MNGDLISRSALLEKAEGGTVCWFDIKHAPAVDAVEVVRCKDCKCGKYPGSTRLVGKYVCCALYDPMPLMRSDDFCSYGERRTDDATD